MAANRSDTFSAKLHTHDREILAAESYALIRKAFETTRRIIQPTIAQTITHLLRELKQRRNEARACECGACTPPENTTSGQPRLI